MDVPSRGGGEREQEDFVGEARERRGYDGGGFPLGRRRAGTTLDG